MFHNIDDKMRKRLAFMEVVDARDRVDGTPVAERLRQIPPETGKFLALMAACVPHGAFLEVGTSGGYSSLWLALACRQRGVQLISFEQSAYKVKLSEDTFRLAGVKDVVRLVHVDATQRLSQYREVAFCFVDIEKEHYQGCYDQVVPNLVPGGIFCADNAISHGEELAEFLETVSADERVDSLVVPIGKGVLVCRKA